LQVSLDDGAVGRVQRANPAAGRLLGRDVGELRAATLQALTVHGDAGVETLLLRVAAGGSEGTRTDLCCLRPDGTTVWVRMTMTADRLAGAPTSALVVLEDLTAHRWAQEALRHQSLHDALTGLPNRLLFNDRVEHALATAGRSATRVGLLHVDLDGFTSVNESAGHAAGDELLREVATRISGCLRPGDSVARLAGDEFGVLCPGVDPGDDDGSTARANLHVVAERVLRALQAPIEVAGSTLSVGASIGSALVAAGSPAERALQQADEAMHGAKRAGGRRIHRHDGDDHTRATRAARLLPELTRALTLDELVVHGQPVLDLHTGHVVAVETLVRWQHPTRGLLSPAHFLDVAEASPLMLALGRRVLDESCRLAAAWSELLGPVAPDVHVNVSGRQLETGSLHDDVMTALERHGLPGDRLVLELTETHLPTGTDTVRSDLQRLRERGIRIAIDDLGTGYSSLTRLTQLPVDVLKIDLAFVAGLGVDPGCDAVVRAVLSIGQAMGLSVVAEGVETPYQAHLLRQYGCDTVQGYLYSPPRPETELLQQLRQAPGTVRTTAAQPALAPEA
ncbi:MAG TPA: EAL domain-containing protein, partial [Actinomycetales bacterium]